MCINDTHRDHCLAPRGWLEGRSVMPWSYPADISDGCRSSTCQPCYWERERQSPGLVVFMENVGENWLRDRKRKTLFSMLKSDPVFNCKTRVYLWNKRDLEVEVTKRSTLTNAGQLSLLSVSSKTRMTLLSLSEPCFSLCGCPSLVTVPQHASPKGHITLSSSDTVTHGRCSFLCLLTSPLLSLHP